MRATPETATQRRRRLVRVAEETAADHDGVLSRGQLHRLGLTKGHVRTQVRAGRWRTCGRQTVVVHTAGLGQRARWRVAVLEVGAGAALDGVSALQAAGLTGYDEPVVHVSVPKGTHPRRPVGVHVHETRLRRSTDVIAAGIPRVRPEVAAVRAALWARSDRQAALIVVMAVQQRLTTAQAVQRALGGVRRHRRRPFLGTILRDVVDGAQALGELDFARMCRVRGLPAPTRQVVRRDSQGRAYLDAYWEECRLVVEIEGIHHGAASTQIADALRQNSLSLRRDTVLRIPLLGLRIAPDEFMTQVAEAFATTGAA
jgi:very-short-patch-repair endonuclease